MTLSLDTYHRCAALFDAHIASPGYGLLTRFGADFGAALRVWAVHRNLDVDVRTAEREKPDGRRVTWTILEVSLPEYRGSITVQLEDDLEIPATESEPTPKLSLVSAPDPQADAEIAF